MRLAAGFVLNQELSMVLFLSPFIWIILDGLCLKERRKGNVRPQNQMGRKNSPGLRLMLMI